MKKFTYKILDVLVAMKYVDEFLIVCESHFLLTPAIMSKKCSPSGIKVT